MIYESCQCNGSDIYLFLHQQEYEYKIESDPVFIGSRSPVKRFNTRVKHRGNRLETLAGDQNLLYWKKGREKKPERLEKKVSASTQFSVCVFVCFASYHCSRETEGARSPKPEEKKSKYTMIFCINARVCILCFVSYKSN